MSVLKFPLVWAVALCWWTRLTGPLSVRSPIHRAPARAQCAGITNRNCGPYSNPTTMENVPVLYLLKPRPLARQRWLFKKQLQR